MSASLRLFLLATLLLIPNAAWAAQLRTEVGARRVGVGQAFEVKVTATYEDGESRPRNPQLQVRGKAEVGAPSIGTRRSMTMRNMSFDSTTSIVATWVVVPRATGKLVIGPGSFQAGGKTLRGETVVVEVVEEAQPLRRRSPFGSGSIFGPDPSDIFGDDPFDRLRRGLPSRRIPDAPPEYQVSAAPHPVSFLRLLVDRKRVVLGEPVRLTVLAYGSRGRFEEASPNEPSLQDFLSYSVIETSHDEPPYRTEIQGREFMVLKLREYVLIPLKTGHLTIGGMTAVLQGNRNAYPPQGSPLGMKVVSPDLDLEVIDAPSRGRPDGYFPGDVGNYRLKASVHPRKLDQGEYAEVIIEVNGAGQIPSKVLLPEGGSVVWEPPTMSGGPEIRDGKLQGTRVLKYALQIKESGELDLGEVTLPYYNHRKRAYKIARADLGTITVTPKGQKTTSDSQGTLSSPIEPSTADIDQGVLLAPREAPGTWDSSTKMKVPWSLWWLFLGVPTFLGGASSLVSWLTPRLKKRGSGKKNVAQGYLKEAKTLLPENPNAAFRLLEKAVYDNLDRATCQRTRGYLREQLAGELERQGIKADLAQDIQAFLSRLEEMRYNEDARAGADPLEEAKNLVVRIGQAEKLLNKKRNQRGARA